MSVSVEELITLIERREKEEVLAALDTPDSKKLLGCTSTSGEYPIHAAARLQQSTMVEALLLAGADPSQGSAEEGSHRGYTAAHHAASNGDLETLKVLSAFKADFNRPSSDGWTPLHVATFKGRGPVMNFLVSNGADVNCANSVGQTPILFAVNHGRVGDVRFLIKNKADLTHKDFRKDTLLHHAFHFQLSKTFEGQYDVPEAQLDVGVVLVLHGVPPSATNADGQDACAYLKSRMPSLPLALETLYAHRAPLLRATVDLNYLSLVSARPDHFVSLGLDEDTAKRFCGLMSKVDDERLTSRKARAAAVSNAFASTQATVTADRPMPTLPAGHVPVSLDELLRSGEDPSGGKCPFFQKKPQQTTASTDDRDKPLCPFSWAFVHRHQTTLLLSFTSFVLGMWTNQLINRVFAKP